MNQRSDAPSERSVPFYACLHGVPGGCAYCSAFRQRDIDLTEAAHDLLVACEMEDHNAAIFKGKWVRGSKAWSGEFITRMRTDAMARIKTLTEPNRPATALKKETP